MKKRSMALIAALVVAVGGFVNMEVNKAISIKII